ncbi:MAG: hypothetical protein ACLUI0_15775 [Blautia massiliensis (ex Durand et al. 2017)]
MRQRFTSGEENSLYTGRETGKQKKLKKNRKQTQKKPEKRRYRKIILSDENTDTGEVEEIQPSEEMTEGGEETQWSFCR